MKIKNCNFQIPILAALLALVFLRGLALPNAALAPNHDSGSAAAKEYFLLHHVQYGTELIENTGPLGFLQFPETYFSLLYKLKLSFSVFINLLYAALVWYMCRWFRNRYAALLWLIANTFIYSYEGIIGCEGIDYVLFVMAAWYLCDGQAPWRRAGIPLIVFTLAALALMKSSYLAISFMTLGCACLWQIRQRRVGAAAGSVFLFLAALAGLWLLTGQRFVNIPHFLKAAGEFARGYQEALALQEEPRVFLRGAAVFLLLTAGIAWRFLRRPWSGWRTAVCAVEALTVFAAWKHGFVRADDHTLIFFAFALTLAPVLLLTRDPESAPEPEVRTLSATDKAKILMCVLVMAVSLPEPAWLGHTARVYAAKLTALTGWEKHLHGLEEQLRRNKAESDLPRMRNVIGEEPVDGFTFAQSILLFNGFSYRPRPVPIPFAANTDYLMEHNAAFYRDPLRAPPYVIAAIATVDSRFPPQDDSLTLLELITGYTPVLVEKGVLLLKRRDGEPAADIERTPLRADETTPFGKRIPVPAAPSGELVWCTADVRYSLPGKIRNFLYKPPQLSLITSTADGRSGTFKFIPPAARTGFIVNPPIQTTKDLFLLYNQDIPKSRQISTVMLTCRPADQKYFAPQFDIRFYSLKLPPAVPTASWKNDTP
jgi:hypothetical protein